MIIFRSPLAQENLWFVITSYSIHYTKLYDFLRNFVPDFIGTVNTVEQENAARSRVITSYSIHYTKLYDIMPHRL